MAPIHGRENWSNQRFSEANNSVTVRCVALKAFFTEIAHRRCAYRNSYIKYLFSKSISPSISSDI